MGQVSQRQITLPGRKIDWSRGGEIVQTYLDNHAAAIDLYDGTNTGPHNEIRPVDLLALNALNAYVGTAPMTPMEALWKRAKMVQPLVAAITLRKFEELSQAEVKREVPKISAALAEIEKTTGFGGGGTRAAKLLHRLRPNIVPLWDALIGEWYGGSTQEWPDYLHAVYQSLWDGENLEFLKSLSIPLPYEIWTLRRWDILLWRLKYEERTAARR
jgi:hypothetical protein